VRTGALVSLVMSAAVLAGCASEIVPQAPVGPPAWTGNVVAALAMLYPPAQTKLYLVKAPPGVTDVLRLAGFGVVEGKIAGPAPRDGYRLEVQTRDLGDGTTAVIAHVGQQTLSRAYHDSQGVTGWSFDLTGASEAMKARVALIQNPPRQMVLPSALQAEAFQQ
jgi:hypothetical protein